jgi:cytochrome c551/c552
MTGPLIGPSFHDIRERYQGSQHAAYLQNRITQGGGGVWGELQMPAMPDVGDDALHDIIAWLIAGEWEEKESEG